MLALLTNPAIVASVLDIADVLREAIDPRFEFVRYAEQLATSQPSFDPLAQALELHELGRPGVSA